MKTLIISDVHSNIIALEAVWRKESDADLVVCAGDIVDYGIYPTECIEWMIDKGAMVVSGGHDLAVIRAYERSDKDEPVTWQMDNAQKLEPRHVEYLRKLPDKLVVDIDGGVYGITHACSGYDIIRTLEAFVRFSDERFSRDLQKMIFGHTHRRELHYLSDEEYWLNPGSVSYRKGDEDYRGAHYAIILDGKPSLRSAAYPVEKLYREVLASPVCDGEKQPTFHWWAPR